jgi:hypothetical protein
MSQHLSWRPRCTLAAAAVSTVLACGVAVPAIASSASQAGRALAPAAAARVPAAAPVLLINGERLEAVAGPAGGAAIAVARGSGPSSLMTLGLGGRVEEIPGDALPYLGHGLDPGLFDLGALRRAETAGRLPLHVTFPRKRPKLPGVTVTRSGPGYEDGYLTASGAKTFGAALARQYLGDHAVASYGRDGLFGGGTKIALAGAPAPALAAGPALPMRTLTMSARSLQGHPDTGDFVILHNEDNPLRLGHLGLGEIGYFSHGTAKFNVPAGHYWAIGVFTGDGGRRERMVVLPQFTVRGSTTVHLAERSATSQIGFSTPRPAALRYTRFIVWRGAGNGDLVGHGWSGSGISLWVNPTTSKPTVGWLQTQTAAQLTSPPGASGTPYAYNLDYLGPRGTIPVQHFDASPASLATVHENYYQDVASTGSWCTIGGHVLADGAFAFSCLLVPFQLPGTRIQYLSTGPRVVWQTYYGQSQTLTAGGQNDVTRNFRPGQQVIQDWNAYPLHPQPDVQVPHGSLAARFPAFPSAFRAGNTLTLYTTPFSDNYPGHLGTGFTAGQGVKVTGSYAIYQNGTQIAHGDPARGIRPVRLSAKPSVITFTLTASRQGPMFPLSPQSTTTWTWRSARHPAATVPQSWSCGLSRTGYQRHCTVQPMMTLNYQVAGLALNGTTAAGPQTVTLSVGHLQLARAMRITGASAKVSFNDGHTFRPAAVTPQGGGRFRICFTAPAGTDVTLRVSATDAAGGSVTETILHGYGIAPGLVAQAPSPRDAGAGRGAGQSVDMGRSEG